MDLAPSGKNTWCGLAGTIFQISDRTQLGSRPVNPCSSLRATWRSVQKTHRISMAVGFSVGDLIDVADVALHDEHFAGRPPRAGGPTAPAEQAMGGDRTAIPWL